MKAPQLLPWLHRAALAGSLSLLPLAAPAQSAAPARPSVAPGYVDLAAHMREVEAAERAERCRALEKKKRKGHPLPPECAQAAPPPSAEAALPALPLPIVNAAPAPAPAPAAAPVRVALPTPAPLPLADLPPPPRAEPAAPAPAPAPLARGKSRARPAPAAPPAPAAEPLPLPDSASSDDVQLVSRRAIIPASATPEESSTRRAIVPPSAEPAPGAPFAASAPAATPTPLPTDEAPLAARRTVVAPPSARSSSEGFAAPDSDLVANARAASTDSDRAAPAPAFPPLAQRSFSPEPLARQSAPLAQPIVESEPLGPTAGMSARAPGPFGRTLRADDELLVGSNGLVANTLRFGGDLARDSVAVAVSWRALSDSSGSMHNTLLLRLSGEPCDDEGPCGLRASGLVGFSPEGRGNFTALIGGAPHSDALDWSSLYFGFGLQARAGNGLGFELNTQLQSASIDYFEGVDGTPVPHDASLGQLKLSAAGSWTRGGFQLRAYLADNVYVSGDTSQSAGAPMQGVFYDSELAGLASGPQGFFGKLEARYLFSNGFALQGGYGFLGYAGPEWASGQVISARFSKELGRFQLALAMAGQFDSLSTPPPGLGTSQATLFFSGSAQAHF